MTTSEEGRSGRRALSPETLAAQALGAVDPVSGALVPPIHLSLAEVTVRQGIERLLRARFGEIVTVVDVTDHEAGRDPFYTPEKR